MSSLPDASFALVEDLYQHNPIARSLNEVVADCVVAYMQARQAGTLGRILEIGAGTGGTSALVLERLEPYRDAVGEYCYTDISRAFLLHAERTYGQRYPHLAYRVFDVTRYLRLHRASRPAGTTSLLPPTYCTPPRTSARPSAMPKRP